MKKIFSDNKNQSSKKIFSNAALPVKLENTAFSELNNFEDGNSVNLKETALTLLKYRNLIGCFFLISFFLSLLYVFTAEPLYTAQAKIKISSYAPVLNSTNNEDVLEQKTRDNNYLETQIQEINSYTLADIVLSRNPEIVNAAKSALKSGIFSRLFSKEEPQSNISSYAESYQYKHSKSLIREYLSFISVLPVRRTALVAIEATHPDPSLAVTIANQQALTYIDWVRNNRIEEQSKGLIFLSRQAEELRERVAALEREIADYAETNSIVALNKDQNITVQKMAQLNQLLTTATSKKIEAQKNYEEALNAMTNNSAGVDDNSVQNMRTELARLEAERNNLSQKFTKQYPRMQQIDSQIKNLRSSIDDGRKQIVSGLQAKALAAAQYEKNVEEELNLQKSQTFELSKRQVQYNILNRELISTRELLQNVVKQTKETSLAVESKASNISLIDSAITPSEPSFPKKKLTVFTASLIGLLLGVLLAYLLDYFDNSVRGSDHLREVLKVPSLGAVPDFKLDTNNSKKLLPSKENSEKNLPMHYVARPKSIVAEAYRAIRTSIILSKAGNAARTILFTSAKSGEGKTTTTINLAFSLASNGSKICIIDADMRRPSLAKYFNLSDAQAYGAGLSEVLTNQLSYKESLLKTSLSNLDIITSGSNPPNPAELLGSVEMASLLDNLLAIYDFILIDSPPVIPVTDSVVLSRIVDGVVLVVRSGDTPKRIVIEAKQRLQHVGAKILGAILNGADRKSNDYYYYNSYYGPYVFDEAADNQSAKAANI